jgi:hypothetical protein
MQTPAEPPPSAPPAPLKRSTGRLTRAQAEALNTWRRRLLEDRPLPGQPRLSPEVSKALGLGAPNRPPASTSDLIAAAVEQLLQEPPSAEDVAEYGARVKRAAATARTVRPDRASPRLPVYPPVTFYLPGELAAQVQALCAAATAAGEAAVGIPDIVRMAIDRWRTRRVSADRAAGLAVAFAGRYHQQPHRAHRDSAVW